MEVNRQRKREGAFRGTARRLTVRAPKDCDLCDGTG